VKRINLLSYTTYSYIYLVDEIASNKCWMLFLEAVAAVVAPTTTISNRVGDPEILGPIGFDSVHLLLVRKLKLIDQSESFLEQYESHLRIRDFCNSIAELEIKRF
jgi:hypothetical protein